MQAAVAGDQPVQQPHQHVGGVEPGAAVQPAVGVLRGGADDHAAVHQPAQAGADHRASGPDHRRVEDHGRVRGRRVVGDEPHRALASALLFPVDDKAHRDRQRPVGAPGAVPLRSA